MAGIVAVAVWVGGGPEGAGVAAAVLFVIAALGGLTMFAGWLEEREEQPGVSSLSHAPREALRADAPAEVRLPVGVVAAHGVGAALTILTVLLALLR